MSPDEDQDEAAGLPFVPEATMRRALVAALRTHEAMLGCLERHDEALRKIERRLIALEAAASINPGDQGGGSERGGKQAGHEPVPR